MTDLQRFYQLYEALNVIDENATERDPHYLNPIHFRVAEDPRISFDEMVALIGTGIHVTNVSKVGMTGMAVVVVDEKIITAFQGSEAGFMLWKEADGLKGKLMNPFEILKELRGEI